MTLGRNLSLGLVGLLALMALGFLGAELFTISQPILKNYNEGWNAYLASAAISNPSSLYPAKAALFANNYPPLSFFLVGVAAKFGGDAIIAGRVIAFLSTLGIAICLWFCARALGCGKWIAGVASLVFLAAPWVIVRFSALDDPQMLGNFLDAAGLMLILQAPRDTKHIALGALFLCGAQFVKPLFITLPLALLVWLYLRERRSALLLAGFGLAFAILGYALIFFFLHVELLGHLFSPRQFFWSRLTGQPGQWLVAEILPLAASLALFRRRESNAFFAPLYAAIAFALAVFFSGGDGVSASQMMDVSVAVSLGAALYLEAAQNKRWTIALMGLTAALQSVLLVLSFVGLWASRPSLPELMGTRNATRYDVALLARQKDPVMCETLALCYWAGRPAQVDAFSLNQAIATKARPAGDFTKLLDQHSFRMIQLQPRSLFEPPSPLWAAIVRNYYLDHQDRNGMFLIPREPLSLGPGAFRR